MCTSSPRLTDALRRPRRDDKLASFHPFFSKVFYAHEHTKWEGHPYCHTKGHTVWKLPKKSHPVFAYCFIRRDSFSVIFYHCAKLSTHCSLFNWRPKEFQGGGDNGFLVAKWQSHKLKMERKFFFPNSQLAIVLCLYQKRRTHADHVSSPWKASSGPKWWFIPISFKIRLPLIIQSSFSRNALQKF